MQQCEPPQQQREENRKLEARVSAEAETRDSEASDAYECRICGYKSADVCSLSQHLHSVHPVTALPGSSSAKDEQSKDARDQTSEGQKSPPAGNVSWCTCCIHVPVLVPGGYCLCLFSFGEIHIRVC